MSLAVVLSRGLAGLDAPLVTVEVHLAGGLPAFNLVGLPMAPSARRDGRAFVLPAESAAEAALVRGATILPATSLLAVCAHLTGREMLARLAPQPCGPVDGGSAPDLADVRGQDHAKRALANAAAGAHSLLIM